MSDRPKRVLLADDDPAARRRVRTVLEGSGFDVAEAADGPAALHALAWSRTDALVLDLGVAGIDGIDVLRAVRARSGVPVLAVSGTAHEARTIAALDAGADDLVVKPYSPLELAARLRAVLRRGTPLCPPAETSHGALHVDRRARTATWDGSPVDLTPKEFCLLAFLAASPGDTFSREALLGHVWASTDAWQSPATVTEHVRRVRTKLARLGAPLDLVETVRGVGYRFRTG